MAISEKPTCSKKWCSRSAYAKGLCERHYVAARSLKSREFFIDMLGSKCQVCGYDEHIAAFDFHHIVPSEKSFNLMGSTRTVSEKLIKEAKKCALLCANCHARIHRNDLRVKLLYYDELNKGG